MRSTSEAAMPSNTAFSAHSVVPVSRNAARKASSRAFDNSLLVFIPDAPVLSSRLDRESVSKLLKSCPVRERLQDGFRPAWQMTDTGPARGKDGIPDRGRDCGRRRLAKADRC